MTDLAAATLYQRLAGDAPPRVLDVRNAEEFARWQVEAPHPVDVLNVPYFEFGSMAVMGIARETLIDGVEVGGVATFLSDAARWRVALFV